MVVRDLTLTGFQEAEDEMEEGSTRKAEGKVDLLVDEEAKINNHPNPM